MDILIKALQLILAFCILIILHEGGHFFFAKLFGTRVERFYLFFNPGFHLFSTYDNWFRRLIGKQPVPRKEITYTDKDGKQHTQTHYEYAGTEYGIGWVPLGGYVAISGMIDENLDTNDLSSPPQPWEFRTKPAWQRLLIMLGGILMNFITAFVIYAMILYTWGRQYIATEDITYGMKFNQQAKAHGFQDRDIILGVDDKTFDQWNVSQLRHLANAHVAHVLRQGEPVDVSLPGRQNLLDMLGQDVPPYATELLPLCIDSILPGSPAETVGLRKGDIITSINGQSVADFYDLYYYLAYDLAARVDDLSTHADSLRVRTVTLTLAGTDSVLTAVLSPQFTLGFVNASPDYPVTTKTYGFLASFPAGVSYGWSILSGYVNDLKYIFTKKGSRSVGGFIAIGNIFPSTWNWRSFWSLTAWLSVALGVMNVLPIPALDGGHVLFTLYEIIARRKPSEKFLIRAQYVGMFLLLAILIYANLNDVLRLFGI